MASEVVQPIEASVARAAKDVALAVLSSASSSEDIMIMLRIRRLPYPNGPAIELEIISEMCDIVVMLVART